MKNGTAGGKIAMSSSITKAEMYTVWMYTVQCTQYIYGYIADNNLSIFKTANQLIFCNSFRLRFSFNPHQFSIAFS